MEILRSFRTLNDKLTFFGFLVMVYDRVDDEHKFSNKYFGPGRLSFHATSHLKVSPVLAREHKLFLFTWYIYRGMSRQSQINVISAI